MMMSFTDLPEPVRALREEQEVYRKRKKALGKGGAREQQVCVCE